MGMRALVTGLSDGRGCPGYSYQVMVMRALVTVLEWRAACPELKLSRWSRRTYWVENLTLYTNTTLTYLTPFLLYLTPLWHFLLRDLNPELHPRIITSLSDSEKMALAIQWQLWSRRGHCIFWRLLQLSTAQRLMSRQCTLSAESESNSLDYGIIIYYTSILWASTYTITLNSTYSCTLLCIPIQSPTCPSLRVSLVVADQATSYWEQIFVAWGHIAGCKLTGPSSLQQILF